MTFPSVDGVELLSMFQMSPFLAIMIAFFASLAVTGIVVMFMSLYDSGHEQTVGISMFFLFGVATIIAYHVYEPTYLVSISDSADWKIINQTIL